MPELPEVELTRRAILPLVGQKLLRIHHQDPLRYPGIERATGQSLLAINRRGKFLLLDLESVTLVVHLGMSGRLSFEENTHTRAILEFGGSRIYFNDPRRFGRLQVVDDLSEIPLLNRMGPEPLSPNFEPLAFAGKLAASKAPVKSVLLGQEAVAGLGNIYTDESLFAAGIHPARSGRDLSAPEIIALHLAIPLVLQRAITSGGSTLSDRSFKDPHGLVGGFQLLRSVYARAGEPCPSCGSPIQKIRIANRTTCFCPNCQPMPVSSLVIR